MNHKIEKLLYRCFGRPVEQNNDSGKSPDNTEPESLRSTLGEIGVHRFPDGFSERVMAEISAISSFEDSFEESLLSIFRKVAYVAAAFLLLISIYLYQEKSGSPLTDLLAGTEVSLEEAFDPTLELLEE